MARLPNISKYCVSRLDGALALPLSKLYAMLTPSIGFWATPLTTTGAWTPVASSTVGTISIMWWNCLRMPPASLMWPGHAMTMPWRVPPKCEATCLVHLNGVSNAHDHATDMCGYVAAEPQASYAFIIAGMGRFRMALYAVIWFGVPTRVPSALVPLSPLM